MNKVIKTQVTEIANNTLKEIAPVVLKGIQEAVETSAGWVLFYNRPLDKSFCFGYDLDDTEAWNMVDKVTSDPTYFINANLEWYDNMISDLENGHNYYIACYYRFPDSPFIDITNARIAHNTKEELPNVKCGQFSEEDTKLLIETLKKLKAKQQKKCENHIKRFGLSKIKAWTYDRMN